METLAEVVYAACTSLEGGAAAALHHFHQQQHPVSMLAARQKPLYAQHLQERVLSIDRLPVLHCFASFI